MLRKSAMPEIMGILIFIIFSLIVLYLNQNNNMRFQMEDRQNVEALLHLRRHKLEAILVNRLNVVYSVAAFAAHDPSGFESTFKEFAERIFEYTPDIRSIQIAPNAVVSFVYPISGNEAALGHDLLNDPNRREDVLRTIERDTITLAGPFELLQGGQALIARIPISEEGQFWGLGIVVIDLPPMLAEAGFAEDDQDILYAIRAVNNAGDIQHAFIGQDTLFNEDVIYSSIELPDGKWELAARPVNGWSTKAPVSIYIIVGGELVALVLALAIFVLVRTPYSLQQKVLKSTQDLRQEITQRVQIEKALRESQSRLDGIISSAMDAIITIDQDQTILLFNAAAEEMFECSASEAVNKRLDKFIPNRFREVHRQHIQRFGTGGLIQRSRKKLGNLVGVRSNGNEFPIEASISQVLIENQKLYTVIIRDITDRKLAEDALKWQLKEFNVLNSVAAIGTKATSVDELINQATQIIGETLFPDNCGILLVDEMKYTLRPHPSYRGIGQETLKLILSLTKSIAGRVATSRKPIRIGDIHNEPSYLEVTPGIQSEMCVPIIINDGVFGVLNVESKKANAFTQQDEHLLITIADNLATAIGKIELLQLESRRSREAFAIAEVSRDISATLQLDLVIEKIAKYAKELLEVETSAVYLSDTSKSILYAAVAIGSDAEEIKEDPLKIGDGILGNIAIRETGEIVNNAANDSRAVMVKDTSSITHEHIMGVSVFSDNQLTGLISVWRSGREKEFIPSELEFLSNLAHQVGIAIQNARLFEKTRQQLADLEVIQSLATALRSAENFDEALPIILDQLIKLLGAGSALLDVIDPSTGEIVSQLAHGVWAPVTGMRTKIDQGVSGHVISTGQPYITSDIVADGLVMRSELVGGLNNVVAVPIVAQEHPIGALWVGQQSSITNEEVVLLTALGEMIGNTFHRMMLHEETRNQAKEIELAYDNTLSGWAKALELRDKETEGHSRRVEELTLQIARIMKISEPEILHIRRGVLLHDIGKMGIPDQLLWKTTSLSDEEWAEMRKHPEYAYDLLHPIEFLRPALDIPYYHHEKWDGTGYPHGLKGEQIPLSARIFSIVDVFDALSNDRPYRKAWPMEKVLEYINEQSGKFFDPDIVEEFFKVFSSVG